MVSVAPVWPQALKDAMARAPLPAEYDQALRQAVQGGDPTTALSAAEAALAFIDAEQMRLAEQRLALGDAQAARQRLTGEPRRAIDLAVNGLKAKLGNEKAEWTRRVQKQLHDVVDSAEAELRGATFVSTINKDHVHISGEEWGRRYITWLDHTLSTWSDHVASLAPTRIAAAVEAELQAINAVMSEMVTPATTVARLDPTATRLEAPVLVDDVNVPTVMEAFIETFKSGLNTVAMLAGMVVVPVVGNFTSEQPTALRAAVMSALIMPVIGFAVFQTVSQRSKLTTSFGERAIEKLKRNAETYTKTRIDRFSKDVERHTQTFVQQAQLDLLAAIDLRSSRFFAEKETSIAGELARAQLQAERLGDQLQQLRQARSALANGAIPDLRRQLG